jgi:hypothetical protein
MEKQAEYEKADKNATFITIISLLYGAAAAAKDIQRKY